MSNDDRMKELYQKMYSRLSSESAIVIFVKKSGDIRVMLATRNVETAEAFGMDRTYAIGCINGHDNRCNIENGALSVIDLEIGQIRSFNVQRLVYLNFLGEVTKKNDIESIMKAFKYFKMEYMGRTKMSDLSYLDDIQI